MLPAATGPGSHVLHQQEGPLSPFEPQAFPLHDRLMDKTCCVLQPHGQWTVALHVQKP